MREVPVLETPLVRLRDWRDDDVEAWVRMNRDPRVREFFPSIPSREDLLAEVARIRGRLREDGYGWWVIERREAAGFAGVIALQQVPFDAAFAPAHEVGWRLPFELWGRGLASHGAAAAMQFAFERLHLPHVVAMTASINVRSQAVMRRLEMSHDAADDFDHPRVAPGDRLRRHVLFRATRPPSWHSPALRSLHERRTEPIRATGPTR